jgi:hypothetical protein
VCLRHQPQLPAHLLALSQYVGGSKSRTLSNHSSRSSRGFARMGDVSYRCMTDLRWLSWSSLATCRPTTHLLHDLPDDRPVAAYRRPRRRPDRLVVRPHGICPALRRTLPNPRHSRPHQLVQLRGLLQATPAEAERSPSVRSRQETRDAPGHSCQQSSQSKLRRWLGLLVF